MSSRLGALGNWHTNRLGAPAVWLVAATPTTTHHLVGVRGVLQLAKAIDKTALLELKPPQRTAITWQTHL